MEQRGYTAEYRANAVKLAREMGAKKVTDTGRYAVHMDQSSEKWRFAT